MKKHVKKYFGNWLENKLSSEQKMAVEEHLNQCSDCAFYFEKMTILLEKNKVQNLPELQPDYFLPQKIAQMARERSEKVYIANHWWKRVRVSFGIAVIMVALLAGFSIGKWMSTPALPTETQILYSYSTVFEDNTIVASWESLSVDENGGQK